MTGSVLVRVGGDRLIGFAPFGLDGVVRRGSAASSAISASSPISATRRAPRPPLPGLLVGVRRLGLGLRLRPRGPIPLDEGREHVIERRPLLASAGDLASARPDSLDDVRQGRPSVVDDDGDAARTVLADAPDQRQAGEHRPVEDGLGLDHDDVATDRLATQLVGGGEREQPAVGDQRHPIAGLGLVDVLGGDDQRPAGIAQPVELGPDPRPQERVDPGGRLIEEEQGRVVDQGAGEFQAALHPARQPPGPPAPDIPQVDQLEGLLGPSPRGRASRTATRRSPRSRGP